MATLRVMTWNVENFFPAGSKDGPPTQAIFDDKIKVLRTTIQAQDPDVVALQEVGGQGPLDELRAALGANTYPASRLSAFPDPRGIRTAFISKLPILTSAEVVDFPTNAATKISAPDGDGHLAPVTRLSRGALSIDVQKGGRTFEIITTHLKSKLLSYPRPHGHSSFTPKNEDERTEIGGVALLKRAAEAATLRIHVNARLKGSADKPLILLGDLNDGTEAQTTQLLYGPEGSQIGTGAFDKDDQGDDVRLFNLAPCIPAARRFSRRNAGVNELIDHILASVELFSRSGQHRTLPVVDSIIDYADSLPTVNNDPSPRKNSPFPDHAPVVATFQI
jgi:endonuclease/exonuclease/phosphatase family metal-dependent hydrolase